MIVKLDPRTGDELSSVEIPGAEAGQSVTSGRFVATLTSDGPLLIQTAGEQSSLPTNT